MKKLTKKNEVQLVRGIVEEFDRGIANSWLDDLEAFSLVRGLAFAAQNAGYRDLARVMEKEVAPYFLEGDQDEPEDQVPLLIDYTKKSRRHVLLFGLVEGAPPWKLPPNEARKSLHIGSVVSVVFDHDATEHVVRVTAVHAPGEYSGKFAGAWTPKPLAGLFEGNHDPEFNFSWNHVIKINPHPDYYPEVATEAGDQNVR